MTYIKKRIKAFGYAIEGLKSTSMQGGPFLIHWLAVLLVVGLGLYFSITKTDWCLVIMCCAAVITTELVNTAIEKLCDVVMPDKNPNIKFIKDTSAAAVLIVAIMSVIVGVIVFLPYVKTLIS